MKRKKTEPSPAKTAAARRSRLEKELRASLSQVDEKGLLFLLRQAQVLIHNARVESMESGAPPGQRPASPGPASPQTVSIEEAPGGATIFLTIGRARKVLAPEEMKRLVRICYGAESKSEALRRLFTVLARERKDILADAIIGSPDHPLLTALFHAVRGTYHLPDR